MMLQRLHAAIAAVAPIDGVSGAAGDIRIDFRPGATAQQRADAQNILANFDWSPAAHEAWSLAQEPDLSALADHAQHAVDTNTAYLALSSPTNAQTLAQIRAMTQQNTRIIRALARVVVRTWR